MSATAPRGAVLLVLAKAPVPGAVKTRLARTEGPERAARLAAAALLDTVETCTAVFGPERCYLAVAGRIDDGVDAAQIRSATAGWTVLPQHGRRFGARIARAHDDVRSRAGGPVVQVGMDTPQAGAADLAGVAARVVTGSGRPGPALPLLGLARDGGWWVLASIRGSDLAGLDRVTMSTPSTGRVTRALLVRNAGGVLDGPVLGDVDTELDAELAARSAPGGRFARAWRDRGPGPGAGTAP